MRAIVLAAGAGTRLSPLTDSLPKCLVRVRGTPLIDYQLEALQAVGVSDIVVVVGYEGDQVRRHCGSRVRYIDNPLYQSTNSIYSLHLATAEMNTDTFLFNCDIVFDAQILQRMLVCTAANALAVDSQVPLIAGEMNVSYLEGRRITAVDKQIDPARAQAQSVQLARFDMEGAGLVRTEVERLVMERRQDVFPTSAYGPLIDRGNLVAVEAGDLPWGEIDSLEDYAYVERFVLPRLTRS